MPLPNGRPDYRSVMHETRRLIEEYGVVAPPVNPVTIARSEGVDVTFAQFEPAAKKAISGFFDCDDNVIVVNADEYPLRQTFTVAHELGHALLHREWAGSDEYQIFYREIDADSDDPHEKEANAFAAHLLVPRFLLDEYWEGYSTNQLSQLFAVSVPMIKNRISFEYGV